MHKLLAAQIQECWPGTPPEAQPRLLQRFFSLVDTAYAAQDKLLATTQENLSELSFELTEHNSTLQRELGMRHVTQALLESEKAEQKLLIQKLEETHNKLLQSEKMASIGQLAAGVAHEINNPIGFVNSNLNSLRSYVDDLLTVVDALHNALEDPAQKAQAEEKVKAADLEFLRDDMVDLLQESQDGIQRVRRIVQDLKDFSHVDQGEWVWADIHRGLDSTLNIVNNEIKYKATVHKDYSELPQLYCQASQLNQVFMNLLVNAAHAIKDKGDIYLRTKQCEQAGQPYICVEVQDTGSGIAGEHLNRIFDPFFTTKPVGTGTGLGLSLSYGIVQKHDGRIEVDSELDVGTTFRVWLPIKKEVANSPATQGGSV